LCEGSAAGDVVVVGGAFVYIRSVNENLRRSVAELKLSVRAANALQNGNIKTVGELVQKTADELLLVKNLGRKPLKEITDLLATMGLTLGMKLDDEL
jgi:DNA-directed RNA polymerase subunit alpha